MGVVAQSMIELFKQVGFSDFLLPFLLFFAIIYAALDKTEIFGKEKRDINALIAFAIAFIAAMTSWVVKAINGFIPWIAFVMIVVVGILMGIALVFGDISEFQKKMNWFGKAAIVIISLVLVGAAIISIPGMSGVGSGFNISLDPSDVAFLVLIVLVLAFFAVVIRKKPSQSNNS